VPRVRSWEGVWCMNDPARTVARTSATTGCGVELDQGSVGGMGCGSGAPAAGCGGGSVLSFGRELRPVEIGFEKNGLDEWALQPLWHEHSRRRQSLPLRAVSAPWGKIDFIGGLQPLFKAGEVEFAKPVAELAEQLLGFPRGRIDAPNALAYALLLLRPGPAVYEAFDAREHVGEADVVWGKPVWLALNARAGLVTGVLVQYVDGQIAILGDWMVEGQTLSVIEEICREASMQAGLAPVAVYRRPFYARWGLTTDIATIDRGGRLSLEELVAGALILYPRYLDPVTRLPCPPEIIIEPLPAPRAIGRPIQGHLARSWNELTLRMPPPAGDR
jgi:hypothetical protein